MLLKELLQLSLASPSMALSEQKRIYQLLSTDWKPHLMVKQFILKEQSSNIKLDDVMWWLPPIVTLRHWLIAQILNLNTNLFTKIYEMFNRFESTDSCDSITLNLFWSVWLL